ncbi:hypothetical protein RvY_09281-1 [Ramazzottius varieornatus]|uniref:Uncharacterized protein n=1 Tax=Ramazzottius varieornatus TaxID=947166 RepID=A0A1D1V8R9_RAMVA|nr:hypothetical protein RvY_09281-1 [Ramazzottius varieornatus]
MGPRHSTSATSSGPCYYESVGRLGWMMFLLNSSNRTFFYITNSQHIVVFKNLYHSLRYHKEANRDRLEFRQVHMRMLASLTRASSLSFLFVAVSRYRKILYSSSIHSTLQTHSIDFL